jgi:hypothetical protein
MGNSGGRNRPTPLLIGPVEQAAGFLEASDDGGDGRQPVAAVVFVDDGRHGSPHSGVAGWKGCRAARNAAASDALAGPVAKLVTQRGKVGFRRRARLGADESFARRQVWVALVAGHEASRRRGPCAM